MASVSSRLRSQLLNICCLRQSLRKCLTSNVNCEERRKIHCLPGRINMGGSKHKSLAKRLCGSSNPSSVQLRQVSMRDGPQVDDLKKGDNLPPTPYSLVEPDIKELCADIKLKLSTQRTELAEISQYFFDGKGKAFRPMLVMLMSKALNHHLKDTDCLLKSQREVSMIAEMIHTASLIHDDVIDSSDTRRGKPSVDHLWGQRKAILAGDYILSVASIAIAQIRNERVVHILSQVIEDLVRGEFMQLGSKEDQSSRFNHYLRKTYKKTASLTANTCKAVAVLAGCTDELTEVAFNYGKNIGMAFQLIDDLLDFTSCDKLMGKPTAADLRLGLATAPILFATTYHRELNSMIMRRFSAEGDVEKARAFVADSNGVELTRELAEQYGKDAIHQLSSLSPSLYKNALCDIVKIVLTRTN